MRMLKRAQLHKKLRIIEREEKALIEEKAKQLETEKIMKEERERSLELWREQIKQKIEDQKQKR